jgi:methyl-accepting chemotaxis protein
VTSSNDVVQERLGSIDDRLAALLAVGERQAENIEQLVVSSREQRHSIEELVISSREQRRSIEELAISSREQRQTIQLMAGMVSELVRAITAMSKNTDRILASAERAAQASEAAAVIAQTNQNAIRDLIAEMRESRG